MAMEPYSRWILSSATRYRQGENPVTYPAQEHIRRTLGDVVTFKGNYSSPTWHRYSKVVTMNFYGSRGRYGRFFDYLEGANIIGNNIASYAPATYDQSLWNIALGKLNSDFRGNTDLSVDLVQWRQVAAMLNISKRLRQSLSQHAKDVIPVSRALAQKLRTSRRRRTPKLYREVDQLTTYLARKRLEYVYGWAPLAGSLCDLGRIATTPTSRRPGLLKVEGYARRQGEQRYMNYAFDPEFPQVYNAVHIETCRITVYLNPAPSVLSDLAKISSLNPVSLLYETIPYSFVLDWFVDVGGWLRNVETAFVHKNDFVGGFSRKRLLWSVIADHKKFVRASDGYERIEARAFYRLTRFERQSLSGYPFPRLPTFTPSLGPNRLLNAAALAKNLVQVDHLIDLGKRFR